MSSYKTRKTPGNTDWFVKDRFGMFIHWGLYSMPARHEWVQLLEEIPGEEYNKYFENFEPDLYDPKEWAKYAREAGMKYAVFTTKHHEGFCMWDTKYTDYKCTNTLAGKDLLREFVDAFRAEGIRVGFYYSLIDWHHPDFIIDAIHPLRRRADVLELNKTRDMSRYVQYMKNQLTELMTEYGDIDVLWFDFTYDNERHKIPFYTGKKWYIGKSANDWKSEELIELIRSYQPGIIINNRAGIEQDLWTPEQYVPTDWLKHSETGEYVVWESCQTFSGSWGYNRDESSWKTPEMLISLLIRNVAQGGNLMMNVGPTARGNLDKRATSALKVYADWMKYNSKSIYNCTKAEPEWETPPGCALTQSNDGSRLYVHLIDYPVGGIVIPGMYEKVKYAQFLHDGSEVVIEKVMTAQAGDDSIAAKDGDLVIRVPRTRPDVVVPVVELKLNV